MRPRIAIPPSLDAVGALRTRRRTHYLDSEYAAAVDQVGGAPVLLPIQRDAEALLEGVDALLLPGGDDFLPPRPYPTDVAFTPLADEQVVFDRALLAGARARGLPVLCLCYGMQLLALSAGGGLHYHLPDDVPEAADHGASGRPVDHAVRVEAGTRLADALGASELRVRSRHHQAVAEPGAGLRVSARAPDGVIEALEPADRGEPFLLAVQWHPEAMDEEHRARIFGALIREATR